MHAFETGFFSRNIPAWHRLGTVVESVDTIDEAIRLAQLDWKVEQLPIFASRTTSDGVESQPVDGWRALIRSTDKRVLHVATDGFTPLQNVDAFRFFQPFLQDGDVKLDAAGSLREGRTVFVTARLSDASGYVKADDQVECFLLLVNSHDGTMAVRICFTPIRAVCMNTVGMALDHARAEVAIRHSTGLDRAMAATQNAIDIGRRNFRVTLEQYQEMARTGITEDSLKRLVEHVVVDNRGIDRLIQAAMAAQDHAKVTELREKKAQKPEAVQTILEGFETMRWPGQELAGKTVWGAYNAVTYYLSNIRGRSESSRLNSNWFGDGRKLRAKLHEKALTLVTA